MSTWSLTLEVRLAWEPDRKRWWKRLRLTGARRYYRSPV